MLAAKLTLANDWLWPATEVCHDQVIRAGLYKASGDHHSSIARHALA